MDYLEKNHPDSLVGSSLVAPRSRRWLLPGGGFITGQQAQVVRDFATLAKEAEKANRKRMATMRLYESYLRLGTLEAAGQTIGVTRERVRQIFATGNRRGWFVYPVVHELPSRDEVLKVIFNSRSVIDAKSSLGITENRFREICVIHGITNEEMQSYFLAHRKSVLKKWYDRLVESLGEHPPTTYFHNTSNEVRMMYGRIINLWGNFTAFRQEYNIPHRGVSLSKYIGSFRAEFSIASDHVFNYLSLHPDSMFNEIYDDLCSSEFASLRGEHRTKHASTPSLGYVRKILLRLIAEGRATRKGIASTTRYSAVVPATASKSQATL